MKPTGFEPQSPSPSDPTENITEFAGPGERFIVTRVAAVRDNDLIATVIGSKTGKFSILAKHARRSQKRFSGGIDIFDCAEGEFARSRPGSLVRLDKIEQRESWPNLRTDLGKLTHAALVLEMADQGLTEGDPLGAKVFELLYRSLRSIDALTVAEHLPAVVCFFALNLFQAIGIDPLEDPGIRRHHGDMLEWWIEMLKRGRPTLPKISEAMNKYSQNQARQVLSGQVLSGQVLSGQVLSGQVLSENLNDERVSPMTGLHLLIHLFETSFQHELKSAMTFRSSSFLR